MRGSLLLRSYGLVFASLLLATAGAAVYAQDVVPPGSIRGHVIEEGTGRALGGAQVLVLNTGAGTIADQEGEFALDGLPAGHLVLRVQLVGYGIREKVVAVSPGETVTADVELRPEIFQLDEVVTTGTAGVARKREVGHSIAEIVPDRIAEPVASVDNLLAARVPGLTVLPSSAMAGSGAQIRLRGNVSVALSNQPLVYVDGVRIRSDGYPKNVPPTGSDMRGPNDVPSPLNDINPWDVERVEVVKGPAATTLYGAEAASGVIQIFTKRGMSGGPAWTAATDQGFDDVQEFGTDDEPYMRIDRWLDSGRRQKYGGWVGGGGDVRYFLSTAYEDDDGVLPNDSEQRLNLRGNFDFSPLDELELAWSTSYTKRDISNTPAGMNAHGLTLNAFRGATNFLGDSSKAAVDKLLDYEISTNIDHLIAGMTATWNPTDRWMNRLTLGYDRAESELRNFRPFGFVLAPQGILSNERWLSDIVSVDYVGSFEVPLSTSLRSTFSWGGQSLTTRVQSVAGYSEEFPGPGEPTLGSGAQTAAFEDRSRVVTGGVFAQTLFGWRDRLFLTTGLRLDGNSAFGEDVGLAAYPRVSLSYVPSEEAFWPATWGKLKLRVAYGHAGRAPGAFDAVRTWRAVGFAGEPAFVPNQVGNPNLAAERTAELEGGFDATFLEDQLTVEVTVYERRTTDALFPVTQTPSLGFPGSQLQNVGKLRSRGVELALNGFLVRQPGFGWDAGVYVATNHSRVLELGGAPEFNVGPLGWIVEGQPAPVLRGTLVKNPDEVGDPDIERDHLFGPNLPTHTIGFQTRLHLPYGVELTARGEYVGGHYILDDASRHLMARGLWPVCDDAYAAIAAGNTSELTAYERVWCNFRTAPQDGPIYPADFFRLRDLTLAVPVPRSVVGSRDAVVTVSARNYLSWKNDELLAFDPEMAGQDGMLSAVRHISAHVPPPASVTVALRVMF